jgi:hypothetical protein
MKIIDVARKYIGQTEKPNNSGFNDVEFEKKMKTVGFQKGQAWCAYAGELVVKEAYPEKFDELDKLCSASAVKTFRNFQKAGFTITQTPAPGCIVVWMTMKNGKPYPTEEQPTGHLGISTDVMSVNRFACVEGNTNDKGGREGYIMAERVRTIIPNVQNGLKLLGFIHLW